MVCFSYLQISKNECSTLINYRLSNSNPHLRSVSPNTKKVCNENITLPPAWERLNKPRFVSPNLSQDRSLADLRNNNKLFQSNFKSRKNQDLTLENQSKPDDSFSMSWHKIYSHKLPQPIAYSTKYSNRKKLDFSGADENKPNFEFSKHIRDQNNSKVRSTSLSQFML